MKLVKWEELPFEMQTDEVGKCYGIFAKRKGSLILKQISDILCPMLSLAVLSPVLIISEIATTTDSHGSAFYKQEQVTQYSKIFKMHKFRTMVQNADKGSPMTVSAILGNEYKGEYESTLKSNKEVANK